MQDFTYKSRGLRSSIVAALGILAMPVANAQDIEEIMVIGSGVGSLRLSAENGAGSRLGLSALDTPASVELITSQEIATKGDYDALSAITRSTGISSTASPGNGGTAVSARGFSGQNSVATTYDGTRLYVVAGTTNFPADTWTVDRVEVLRGAGSVINGIGAIGATINYVPKQPAPGTSSFDALVAAGSFNMQRAALGGGADLNEDWAFRLDGAWQASDSNVDRVEEERQVLAGSLLFHPTEDFSMRLNIDYADIHEDSPYFGTPLINGEASDAHRENNYNFGDGFLDYEDTWTRLHTEWELTSSVTFRNDTYLLDAERQWQNLESYAYNDSTGLIDRDGFSYYGIIHDVEQVGTRSDFLITGELGGMENRLTIGADINEIDLGYSDNWSEGMFYAGNSVPVFGWTPDTLADANIPTVLDYTTETSQWGIFLDDVLQVNEEWSLVIGLRYDDIDYSRFDLALGGNPASSFDTDYSEFSWRAGVVYEPTDSMSIYAQISQATDPVTSPASMSSSYEDYEPTRGRQYEIGLKQQVLEGRGEYTLAWFDIEKTDLLTRRPDSMITDQIGSQSSSGLEATFRFNPTDRLSLDMNATWVDAEYDEYFSDGNSLAGNTPRNIPDTTMNAWLNWMPVSKLELGAGIRYVDSRYQNNENTSELPAYTVVDAAVSWNFNEQTTLTLRARNLTDEEDYVLSGSRNQFLFAEPRNYELSIRYSM